MINITKWRNITSGIDKDSKTYLSFVKGNKDISYYFMKFIDCDNKTTSSESTQNLIIALNEFYADKQIDREGKIRKKNQIFTYCTECMDQKKEIQLSTISNILDPENPEDFRLFASSEKFSVNEIISGDRAKLKIIKYVAFRSPDFSIEFNSDLLDKNVFFNSNKNELTIKHLPKSLIDQIPK